MSDFERFLELYHSFGIDLEVEEKSNGHKYITITARSHPKIIGYCMFFTEIAFDEEGNFINQGVWE